MTRVRESEIIAPLMADPRFRAFYAAERPAAGVLAWYIAPHLVPDHCLAAVHWRSTGAERYGVMLRNRPDMMFAEHIAHEISHPIFWQQGFPYLWADDPKYRPMANYLANMPHDLLVYDLLALHGFPRTPLTLGKTERRLHALMQRIGYDTPGRMEVLLRAMLKETGYTHALRIVRLT